MGDDARFDSGDVRGSLTDMAIFLRITERERREMEFYLGDLERANSEAELEFRHVGAIISVACVMGNSAISKSDGCTQ